MDANISSDIEESNGDPIEFLATCPCCRGEGCDICHHNGSLSLDVSKVSCKDGQWTTDYFRCPFCRDSSTPGCEDCEQTGWIREDDVEGAYEAAGYIRCPTCEGSGSYCYTCEEVGWLSAEVVAEELGEDRIRCLACSGEGQVDSWGDRPLLRA